MMFDQELECCGAEFEKDHISFIGLLTLSLPLLVICSIIKVLFLIIFKKNRSIELLINANFKLIKQKNILTRSKCQLSSFVFKLSPRLSGLIFKYFNLTFLLIIWLIAILSIYQVASL